jgi:hydroxymethylbilane synthase
MTTVRIATRRSALALWQAEHVGSRLKKIHDDLRVELVAITTRGDKLLGAPLHHFGGKGLFVKELEQALLSNTADIAAHSMKDVPVELTDRLHLPVIMTREDPWDALVSTRFPSFEDLPSGCRVGTSSLRRKAQLRRLRPDIDYADLRGNVDARVVRLDRGEFDAIVLASAGLKRLGLRDRITQCLPLRVALPAIGQGAIGIECRRGDAWVEALVAPLNHRESELRVRAERAMNRSLGGGCQVPIAGFADYCNGRLRLQGLVARVDGSQTVHRQAEGPAEDAERLGESVATELLAGGGDVILEEFYRHVRA